jgi:asparagine synthase (glutamine-hydrolysing)
MMGYVPGTNSIINDVNKLEPGHFIVFDVESQVLKIVKYWNIPEYNYENIDEEELLDSFEKLLSDSVQKQLIGDVPVGVLLSGGLDSSLITAMAARSSNKINTFTVRFPGYSKFDETNHARLISNYFNTNHVELDVNDLTTSLLPLLAKQYDEPIIDSSMIPTYLVSKLVKQYCTVALGGDGGDELFGGYNHHSRLLKLSNASRYIHPYIKNSLAYAMSFFKPLMYYCDFYTFQYGVCPI